MQPPATKTGLPPPSPDNRRKRIRGGRQRDVEVYEVTRRRSDMSVTCPNYNPKPTQVSFTKCGQGKKSEGAEMMWERGRARKRLFSLVLNLKSQSRVSECRTRSCSLAPFASFLVSLGHTVPGCVRINLG